MYKALLCPSLVTITVCCINNNVSIYSLKGQYGKEQGSSLAKFLQCARVTFQLGNLVMIPLVS